jgi:ParB-like chromosome segregation protein Spo0J
MAARKKMPMLSDEDGRQRKLEVVRIDDLRVDHRYQRELNQALVERILDGRGGGYDLVAADVITVAKRPNGELFIVNGQHRAAAAKIAGEAEMLAFVYDGLSIEQEADLRLKSNTRRSDTSLERFWGMVAAGDQEAIGLRDLIETAGGKINRTPNSHTGINAIAALESMYADDQELLTWTLQAITEAYGSLDGENVMVPQLRGLYWFLKVHEGEYNWRTLIERAKQHGPEDLMRKSRAHRAVSGGADWLNVYRALLEVYNHRRMEHTRLQQKVKFSSRRDRT